MDAWDAGAHEPWGEPSEPEEAPTPWRLPDPLAEPAKPRWSQDDAGPMYWLLKALAERETADRAAVDALLRSL